MTEQVLKNCKLFVGGYNLTGDMNSLTLNYSADILDKTVFGSTFRQRKAGLLDTEITCAGFWNSSEGSSGVSYSKVDPVAFNKTGSSDELISVLPEGTGIGNIAWFGKGFAREYGITGNVGEMLGFTFAAVGDGNMNRGKVLLQGGLTSESTQAIINLGKTPPNVTYGVGVGVHITGITTTGGASAILEVSRSSSTDFTATASTIYSISLTTGSVGTGLLNTTYSATHGSIKNFSYRCKVLNQNTSDNTWRSLIVVGHEKKFAQ